MNQTFVLIANVSCSTANCGSVNGVLRYNSTASLPDTSVNSGSGTPFHTSEANPRLCGNLNAGESCVLNWTVNATGAVNSIWKLDVNFSSSSISGNTSYTTIQIIAPTIDVGLSDELGRVRFESNLTPGSSYNPAINNSLNIYNLTCTYLSGTCNVTIKANNNFTSGGSVINIGNLSWSTINNSVNSSRMSFVEQVVNNSLANGVFQFLYFWLDIPVGQTAGSYISNFTVYVNPN